jgi:hypothetical protein
MIGQNSFNVREWDWFKLQIRLQALEVSGKLFVTRYNFPEPGDRTRESRFPNADVECLFWCKTTEELLKKQARRAEHLEFYKTGVQCEERRLREILWELPILSKEIDLHKNVVFTVLHNYGMGSIPVCHFYEKRVHWDMPPDRVPE